jgi:hypothetical protein
LPSEEDLDRATMTSASAPTPAGLVTTSSANNVVATVRQTAVAASSKDDTSIASGSSGCGSLTKKKSQGITAGKMQHIKILSFILFKQYFYLPKNSH